MSFSHAIVLFRSCTLVVMKTTTLHFYRMICLSIEASRVVSSIWLTKPALANLYLCQGLHGKTAPLEGVTSISVMLVFARVTLVQMVELVYHSEHHLCKLIV